MRRLFHTIHRAASFQHPAVMQSPDAEKAFDRIERPYLFHTLERYGLGPVCSGLESTLFKTTCLCPPPLHYQDQQDKDVLCFE